MCQICGKFAGFCKNENLALLQHWKVMFGRFVRLWSSAKKLGLAANVFIPPPPSAPSHPRDKRIMHDVRILLWVPYYPLFLPSPAGKNIFLVLAWRSYSAPVISSMFFTIFTHMTGLSRLSIVPFKRLVATCHSFWFIVFVCTWYRKVRHNLLHGCCRLEASGSRVEAGF
jgi:hypothetical protein